MGEKSLSKSYYPELRRRLADLERFRAVIDHANDAIFVFRADSWIVTDVNETALTLLDMQRDAVIGSHITSYFPPEIAERYAKLRAKGEARDGHIVTMLCGADDRRVPMEITVTLHNFAGADYAVVVARDITLRQQMETELDKSRQLFSSFMKNSPAISFIKDISGRYIFCNPAFAKFLGRDVDEIIGLSDTDIWGWSDEAVAIIRRTDQAVLDDGHPRQRLEHMRPFKDGPLYYVQFSKFPLVLTGKTTGIGGIGVDITRQVKTERALKKSEERHRIVAEYTHGMECWIGPDGTMLYVSPFCERITGHPREYFMADPQSLERLVHPEDVTAWRKFHSLHGGGDDESLDYRICHTDGGLRWVNEVKREVTGEDGESRGMRISLRDITDRKEMELRLRHLALHDPLTGLANRTLCLDRIRQAMARSRRREHYLFAVLFLDIDRFKVLNDSLGHGFGDKVLVAMAKVLRENVRNMDTVSRFGGDEFVLVLEELTSPREALQAVQRIQQAVRRPLSLDGHDIQLTVSVGVVLDRQEHESPEDFLRNANVAMHQAKRAGRDRCKAFTKSMLDRASRLLRLETDLRRAIGRGEFFLAYQPIMHLNGHGGLYGFEALVRWRHPQRGVIPPVEFIPVAEDTGLITEIGLFVLREACATLAAWRAETPAACALTMGVNLSPRQFSSPALVESVRSVLAETGLPADVLKLEITETAIMENAESAVEKLKRLKGLSIALSMDDFGTGYSSMSILQRFPLDMLKIDLSFIRQMDASPKGLEIVKAIINLAHTLQLEVVAEGVERPEQKTILTVLGCEYAQGYLFARPLAPEQALKFVRASEKA